MENSAYRIDDGKVIIRIRNRVCDSIDMVLYANNYEEVDQQHPVIERFDSPEQALEVFRAGAVMSKGTTTTTGLVHTYFANIFGALQYRDLA